MPLSSARTAMLVVAVEQREKSIGAAAISLTLGLAGRNDIQTERSRSGRIEEVFRILKSNGLKIEDSQLETADRLLRSGSSRQHASSSSSTPAMAVPGRPRT